MSDINNALPLPASRSGNAVKLLSVCAAFALIVWVLLSQELPGSGAFVDELQNSGHALIFAAAAVMLAGLLGSYPTGPLASPRRRNAAAFAVCVLVGGTVELVQSGIGREASWYDLSLDATGAIAGLYLFSAADGKNTLRARKRYGLAGVLLLSLCFTLPAFWLYAGFKRDSALPYIADFETRWTNLFTESFYRARVSIVPAPPAWTENKGHAARISVAPGDRWPGLAIREPAPDWTGFSTLRFSVFSEAGDDFRITFRVNDARHNLRFADRFNVDLTLHPGVNHFAIQLADIRTAPAGREMDMENIALLAWYINDPGQRREFYIDNIYLDGPRILPGGN